MNSKKIHREADTAERIFVKLIDAILANQFPVGTPLREKRIATEWGVSRTPFREAIRRAAEAGFVILRPNRAPLVRPLTPDDVDAIYDLRAVLEQHALKLAWKKLERARLKELKQLAESAADEAVRDWSKRCLDFDRQLHAFWTERCGNDWLRDDIRRLQQFIHIFQNWTSRKPDSLRKAYREHLEILQHLRKDDQEGALNALQAHILTSAAAVKEVLLQRPDLDGNYLH